MRVIDSHVHVYPDRIAGKVTESLGEKFGNAPAFVASVEGCRAHSEKSHVSVSVNLPVATDPSQVVPVNRWAADINAEGGSVISLASLHPDSENKKEIIEGIASSGFRGIKFHPEYQRFRLDDPRMDEVWPAMAENGLVAYLHAGGERVFRPPYHSSPREILALQERFPSLTVAAAHLGGFEMWEESEDILCGSPVYLDLSHTLGWAETERVFRMIKKHGAHRILFASDAPWQDPGDVLSAFMQLDLSDGERELILHVNAERLFRIPAA